MSLPGWKGPGRQSITFRLTLLFAAVSATVLLLLGLLVEPLVARHFEELDKELLSGKLELIERALQSARTPQELKALPERLGEALVGHSGLMVKVLAPGGVTVFATDDAAFPDALMKSAAAGSSVPIGVWETPQHLSVRGMVVAARTGDQGAAPTVVAVATDITHHEHFLRSFRTTLWSIIVLAAVLAGFLGWIVARRGLAPLQALRHRAAAFTSQKLDTRLSLDAVPVELVDLTRTLNDMLARLEDSFRRLSDFSSDLAHELRSPVSNLLTQTQVTLSRARTPEEYRDVLASNAEEFERLSRMIGDMLFLAKADNNLIIPEHLPVDLAGEVQGVLDYYEDVAEERGITLSSSGHAQVPGDRLMLRRAVSNLLSNALRYTPRGGEIAVRIAGDDDAAAHGHRALVKVAVSNSGEPIAPAHLPRLFDRFYRVEASRERFSEGAGLGLAITRSILRAHGGDVQVRSDAGMTTFEMSLPVAPVGTVAAGAS